MRIATLVLIAVGMATSAQAQPLTVDSSNSPYVLDADAVFDSVTVENGGLLVMNARVTATTITVRDGCTITHDPGVTSMVLEATSALTVELGGAIDVTGKGLAAGPGAGFGEDGATIDPDNLLVARGATAPLAAGSHGGPGGSDGPPIYGDPMEPAWPGGGGCRARMGFFGGAGGGAVRIEAGTVTVVGEIRADGVGSDGGGAGAGGAIFISAVDISGTGPISAARGGLDGTCVDPVSGGGGGRIGIVASGASTFTGDLDVAGGGSSCGGEVGQRGTVFVATGGDVVVDNFTYVVDQDTALDSLTLLNGANVDVIGPGLVAAPIEVPADATVRYLETGAVLPLATPMLGTVVVEAQQALSESWAVAGTLRVMAPLILEGLNVTGEVEINAPLEVTGDMQVDGAGIVTHAAGEGGFELTVAGTLVVASTASINTDYRGLRPGPLAGYGDTGEALDAVTFEPIPGSGYANGASHGGLAPINQTGSSVNPVYGDALIPVLLGAGGGTGWSSLRGGYGGGKIDIEAGALVLSGTLSANGEDCYQGSTQPPGGSGAGGSIYLRVGTLSGPGAITADSGGTGNAGWGGAGGGRVAVYYQSNTHSGPITVSGSGGGGDGSIYLEDGEGNGTLVIGTATIEAGDALTSLELGGGAVAELYGGSIQEPLVVPFGARVRVLSLTALDAISLEGTVEGHLEVLYDAIVDRDVSLSGTLLLDAELHVRSLHATSGAVITHPDRSMDMHLIADSAIQIDDGALLDGVGRGLKGGLASAPSETIDPDTGLIIAGHTAPSGGWHASAGGAWSTGDVLEPFDNPANPRFPGGGGGYYVGANGGDGGGVVRLSCSVLTLDGTITVDGLDGAGGGAGGSIVLDTVDWRGATTGSVSANGGDSVGVIGAGGGAGGLVHATYALTSFAGTVTVTGGGASSTAKFGGDGTFATVEVSMPPTITSSPPTSVVAVGSPWSYTAEAAGSGPITWSLFASPQGASVDDATGEIQWTPTDAGERLFIVRATNANGYDEQEFFVAAMIAPAITSTGATTAYVGLPYAYDDDGAATATGTGPITWSVMSGPQGFAIDAGSGRVTWTPATTGVFDARIRASNAVGLEEEYLTITVDVPPTVAPQVTSVAATTAVLSVPYQYDEDGHASANGTPPLTWSVAVAPVGFGIDADSGEVTWTPVEVGTKGVCLAVTSPYGSDLQCFSVAVSDVGIPPQFTSTPTTVATQGQAYTYDSDGRAVASGSGPMTFSVVSGPAGFSIEPGTGLVTWTPSAAGAVDISLQATSPYGEDTQLFTVTVLPVGTGVAPVIVRTARGLAAVGTPYAYDDDGVAEAVGDAPIVWTKLDGPSELHIDAETGLVSWTPLATGLESITIAAENAIGQDQYTFVVDVTDSPGTTPVAVATATVQQGDAPLEVGFDGSASVTPDGSGIASWRWDFGDQSPFGFGAAVTHTFEDAGTYVVRLQVRNEVGATDTTELTIRVSQAGQVPPSARILASSAVGVDTLEVSFNCDCEAGSAPIAAYRWDFGDGSLSDRAAVSHLFGPGGYLLRLTVADADGLTGSDSVFVSVSDGPNLPPLVFAHAIPTPGPAPLDVQFAAVYGDSAGEVESVEWSFGDGATAAEPAPRHTYTDGGTYVASVTVTDDGGLASTTRLDITTSDAGGLVPPEIISVPSVTAVVDEPYRYDDDGTPAARGDRPLTWTLHEPPAGMTIHPATGEIVWTPTADQIGLVPVVMIAANDGGTAAQRWEIEVTGEVGGDPPSSRSSGCSCRSGDAPSAWLGVLGCCLLLVRRRR